jgi:hypothetical protein
MDIPYRPPKQKKEQTKLIHQWLGPVVIKEAVGYDNFRVRREDGGGPIQEL